MHAIKHCSVSTRTRAPMPPSRRGNGATQTSALVWLSCNASGTAAHHDSSQQSRYLSDAMLHLLQAGCDTWPPPIGPARPGPNVCHDGSYQGHSGACVWKERLLHIDILLDGTLGSCFFTKLDLASSYYHQLGVLQANRLKTSFRSQLGQFEWNRALERGFAWFARILFGVFAADACDEPSTHIGPGRCW